MNQCKIGYLKLSKILSLLLVLTVFVQGQGAGPSKPTFPTFPAGPPGGPGPGPTGSLPPGPGPCSGIICPINSGPCNVDSNNSPVCPCAAPSSGNSLLGPCIIPTQSPTLSPSPNPSPTVNNPTPTPTTISPGPSVNPTNNPIPSSGPTNFATAPATSSIFTSKAIVMMVFSSNVDPASLNPIASTLAQALGVPVPRISIFTIQSNPLALNIHINAVIPGTNIYSTDNSATDAQIVAALLIYLTNDINYSFIRTSTNAVHAYPSIPYNPVPTPNSTSLYPPLYTSSTRVILNFNGGVKADLDWQFYIIQLLSFHLGLSNSNRLTIESVFPSSNTIHLIINPPPLAYFLQPNSVPPPIGGDLITSEILSFNLVYICNYNISKTGSTLKIYVPTILSAISLIPEIYHANAATDNSVLLTIVVLSVLLVLTLIAIIRYMLLKDQATLELNNFLSVSNLSQNNGNVKVLVASKEDNHSPLAASESASASGSGRGSIKLIAVSAKKKNSILDPNHTYLEMSPLQAMPSI